MRRKKYHIHTMVSFSRSKKSLRSWPHSVKLAYKAQKGSTLLEVMVRDAVQWVSLSRQLLPAPFPRGPSIMICLVSVHPEKKNFAENLACSGFLGQNIH